MRASSTSSHGPSLPHDWAGLPPLSWRTPLPQRPTPLAVPHSSTSLREAVAPHNARQNHTPLSRRCVPEVRSELEDSAQPVKASPVDCYSQAFEGLPVAKNPGRREFWKYASQNSNRRRHQPEELTGWVGIAAAVRVRTDFGRSAGPVRISLLVVEEMRLVETTVDAPPSFWTTRNGGPVRSVPAGPPAIAVTPCPPPQDPTINQMWLEVGIRDCCLPDPSTTGAVRSIQLVRARPQTQWHERPNEPRRSGSRRDANGDPHCRDDSCTAAASLT